MKKKTKRKKPIDPIEEIAKNCLIEEMIQMVENISTYEFVEKVQKRIKERTQKDMEIEDVKDMIGNVFTPVFPKLLELAIVI